MKIYPLVALISCMVFCGAAGAEQPKGKATPVANQRLTVPPVISRMIERGRNVTIVDSFPVADTALVAWVLASGGENRVYYVTPDQGHVIYGLLFDGSLVNLTSRHIGSYPDHKTGNLSTAPGSKPAVPEMKLERGARIASAFDAARTSKEIFSEGAGEDIYVVFDPGCKFCHRLWESTRSLPLRGKVHWIPVGTATKAGAGLAQSIANGANRSDMISRAARRQLEPAREVRPAVTSALARNAEILDIAGKHNVPFILFEEEGEPVAYVGVPSLQNIKRIFSTLPREDRK